MNKRFLINCEECGKSRKIWRDKVHNYPTFTVPSTWIKVDDSFVCSFGCASDRYKNMEDKNIFQSFMEKLYGVATLVPGVN